MKAVTTLLLLLSVAFPLKAQNLKSEPAEKVISDEVQKAIDEFNRIKREGRETENEVTVVLEPPAPEEETTPAEKEAVLITGKPPEAPEPEASEEISEETPGELVILEELIEPEAELPPEPAPETKEPGLEIKVESVSKGTGEIDPSEVKLKASFSPKPLSAPPAGWALEKSGNAPALVKEVELQPGTSITLRIQPHVLSPEADGINVFSVGEPGFETALGYRQTQTVSAILGESVAKLDNDSLRLGNAISDLHNLLASLPRPEPIPEEPAE